MVASSQNEESSTTGQLTTKTVTAWLRKNPDFLFENPSLLTLLKSASSERQEGVVDMQSFILERVKTDLIEQKRREKHLLATMEDNVAGQEKVHNAVIAIVAETDIHSINNVIRNKLPQLLDIEAAVLCIEEPSALALAGANPIGTGGIRNLFGKQNRILLQSKTPGEPIIFGDASDRIKSVAFLKLTTGQNSPEMLLALGSGHDDGFSKHQGTNLLTFLAHVIEERLKQCLGRKK
ncbi:MAG: DUF484 family protein [Pseudomonadota bacterium]|nr:DUF484 family protein [Pseudomonadota bacterium]